MVGDGGGVVPKMASPRQDSVKHWELVGLEALDLRCEWSTLKILGKDPWILIVPQEGTGTLGIVSCGLETGAS